MARPAVTQEAFSALRQRIAKIENAQPGWGADGAPDADARVQTIHGVMATGAERLDKALGGGLPRAALTEIHGGETRNSGAVAGFALALAARMQPRKDASGSPVLWIGLNQGFWEMGALHAPGVSGFCGLPYEKLLVASVARLADALWLAEEAARLNEISGVILEIQGNPARVDLTATRRLHRRAQWAGRPVFLLRQAALAEPTAAPVRLVVSPAPAGSRRTIAGPMSGSIGWPAFKISIDKGHSTFAGAFIVEWNGDARAFQERRSAHHGAVVSPSGVRPGDAAADGQVVALEGRSTQPAGIHPPGEQYPARRGSRRAG